ncbi:tRNA (adenosine(37)-N6)-threonylcarbamoyltransferase complex ATPase subunit type 1 TsaE [Rhizobium sp. L1K21]|uniref:tRNA (adenosine(37)-N6)-threonylcarbamoyltransferase complex ATPase subunit type 1 TsaE n=1 Tax=Rhizobium sp. L1K21 TaxID=2954933 RepID=UPI0020924FAE|nr:tRNA (adenosine(37)-N6)-threonylcarbamoyltransferase complex ATPase subunit type 1 TsaE [Rhizobium sp. L1K21]MCO6187981.1 tRNA (adenosine(37)-N6)-threonylcarbamoyltransferase complex ATPase subunit type 1 TsaE [Rhizobium sp. L1K21]
METLSLFLADENATRRLGEDLALAAAKGLCIALSGGLGAGKSTLARAFIHALANDETLEVPSPTFTLVQSYDLRIPVSHFDLYRLGDESELDELGLDEALEDGIALIEWPDRAGDALPANRIDIIYTEEGGGRRLEVKASGPTLARLKRVLTIRTFLEKTGHAGASRRFLTGDTSFRAYERITDQNGEKFVLMDSPARSNGPPIRDGKPYSQLVHLAEDVRPFIAVGRYLKSLGLSAPEIFEADQENGILLIEDLGCDGVLDDEGKPIAERYQKAVLCLADFHRVPAPASLPIDERSEHIVPHFDRAALSYEVELLLDWHLPWKRDGGAVGDGERKAYLDIWQNLFDQLGHTEQALILRDYHSPNLLWLKEREGLGKVGIIDFQDAIIGPSAYDVVSLVQDARVTVERPLMDALLEDYLSAREAQGPFDRVAFMKTWAIMSAQRACRLNGLWVRLMQRDHLPAYMRHMPRTLWHLQVACEHEALAPLKAWLIKAGILSAES